jgi:hypothetical protein
MGDNLRFIAGIDGFASTGHADKIRMFARLQHHLFKKERVNELPELEEKDIFREAMVCLKYDAGRAAIIMVWNIAFYHLCKYLLMYELVSLKIKSRLGPRKWKVTDKQLIKKYDDFGGEMSEREVLEVASSAGITGAMFKVYKAKLDDRSSAAHPSAAHVTQVQAEGCIDSLINNTIALLKI